MTSLQAGTFQELEVARQAEFGFFLTNGKEDVLLHRSEITGDVSISETLQVFLYHDHQNRLAATMHQPLLALGDRAWLRVVDVNPGLGVYLDMGLRRDLLLPYSECPHSKKEWPIADDYLYVQLTQDKQGRMLAKLVPSDVILAESMPGERSLLNKLVTARVYKQFPDGAFLLSEERYVIFLPKREMKEELRLGQEAQVRITFVREDGRLNASFKPAKEEALVGDSQMIYNYLEKRGGSMPYHDKTQPDIIEDKFGLSKAAFKRALGRLMKEGKVIQKDGWTLFTEQENRKIKENKKSE